MIAIGVNVGFDIKRVRRPHFPSTIQPTFASIIIATTAHMLTKPALLAHWHQMSPFIVLSIDAKLPNGLIPQWTNLAVVSLVVTLTLFSCYVGTWVRRYLNVK